MRKQAGQAFILVLIVLAIGALLVVPSLRLTGTSLMSSQVVERRTKGLYAVDAAQEWVLWNLKQPDFANSFVLNEPQDFEIDVCGTPANITIVMIATESKGGLTLYGDDVIQPTKTVECEGRDPPNENEIPNDWSGTVTYTINLEQLSSDTSQGLDVIYDILPSCFDESDFVGNCRLKVDGVDLGDFPPPAIETGGEHAWGGRLRLRWPNPEIYPYSDNFTTDSVFKGIRNFAVRQVKELSFEMIHTFSGADKDVTHCNWVVLKMEDGTNTLSGPQAPIVVGSAEPEKCKSEEGLIEVSKDSNPKVIPPFVKSEVRYTISMINRDGMEHKINSVTDYLPPGFHYCSQDPLYYDLELECLDPDGTIFDGREIVEPSEVYEEEFNDVLREVVRWDFAVPVLNISAGESMSLSFSASTTKKVSGSYFNEVALDTDVKPPWIFVDDIGLTQDDFNRNYSWMSGVVMVPAYDSEADADGTTIDANFALVPGSITITSWHVR